MSCIGFKDWLQFGIVELRSQRINLLRRELLKKVSDGRELACFC